jgi:hypothetical protein
MKADAMKNSYGSGTTEASMKEEAMMKKDAMKADAMKKDQMMVKDAMVGKPVNCPTGTVAQDNGTCLLVDSAGSGT